MRFYLLAIAGLSWLAAPAAPAPVSAALSLEFIQNKGQWDRQVRYAAPLPAGRLFVRPTGFTYSLLDPTALRHHHGAGEPAKAGPAAPPTGLVAGHAYHVEFDQASRRAALTAEEPTGEVRNYLVGSDERRWASGVGSFRRLRYTSLWPGIDARVYENAGQHLEYDFELAPGADPARIGLRYEGVAPALDAAGNLLLPTTVGTVTELAPAAWQTDPATGARQPVACRYRLAGQRVSFVLGAYDRARPLTIDPTVVFSSLTGAASDNWGFTATYDDQGNMYSGGISFGPGYPATVGALNTQFSAAVDIAIIKYNTASNGPAARAWATYLGGNGAEFPHSLVVNAQRELVLLGSTSSTDYPTTVGAVQRRFGGGSLLDPYRQGTGELVLFNGSDLVVSRLRADGGALLASTYLGGSGNDGIMAQVLPLAANYGDVFRSDVLLDGAGNVYIASNTTSPDFPGLSTGFGSRLNGSNDALVCSLPPGLGSVRWAGLLGGTGADAAYSIQRDAVGRIFVCGGTTSLSLPATAGSFGPGPHGGVEGFVARISADGQQLERTAFIGTANYDQAQFVQLDEAGSVYLFGQTLGSYPRTAGLYGANNPNGSLFIQKLNADLSAGIYSTVFGDNGFGPSLVPSAFLVDDCERVYICGWGGDVNSATRTGGLGGTTNGLPTTAGAFQRSTDGSDFYLAQFAPGMRGLEYATFFGRNSADNGEHVDGGTSRFDRRGAVYQAVCANCRGGQGFPVPPGASTYTPTNGSANCNNGAFKVDFGKVVADPGPRRFLCADSPPVPLLGSPAGGTWAGPGVQPAPGGGFQFAAAAAGPGAHQLTYTATTTGICQSVRRVRYLVAPPVRPVLAPVPAQCPDGPALALLATPAGGLWSGPGVQAGNRFDPRTAGPGSHLLRYTISDSLGCGTDTVRAVVGPAVKVVPGPDTVLCADQTQPYQLRGYGPAGGTWSGPGVSAGGLFTPPATANRGGLFTLTYTVRTGSCQATATRQVLLAPTATQNEPLRLPVCASAPQYGGLAPLDVPLTAILPGGTYEWDFGDGTPLSTEAAPTHRYEQPGTYRIRLTSRYAGCQVLTQFAPLEVGEAFLPNIITPNRDPQGLNETFSPLFSCQPASLKVFSRWGQLVFETDEYHNDWDAAGLAAGHYYYLLRDAAGRTAKGWVEVAR